MENIVHGRTGAGAVDATPLVAAPFERTCERCEAGRRRWSRHSRRPAPSWEPPGATGVVIRVRRGSRPPAPRAASGRRNGAPRSKICAAPPASRPPWQCPCRAGRSCCSASRAKCPAPVLWCRPSTATSSVRGRCRGCGACGRWRRPFRRSSALHGRRRPHNRGIAPVRATPRARS